MIPHYSTNCQPDQSLLNLKVREMKPANADNPANSEARCCFHSVIEEPQRGTIRRVMEDNYRINLRLEDFAKLCARSLSAFKRDFSKLYNTTPGKWLIEKRLDHALHLLTNSDKSVSEAAFDSGFENASHFSRVFRQRFGSSPMSIRRQQKVA